MERPEVSAPLLSVIVVFYRMQREAPRTLHSLSTAYQLHATDYEYEVIAVENPSEQMLDAEQVKAFGENFRLLHMPEPSLSPAAAVNYGVSQAQGEYVMILVDGARIVSPGVLHYSMLATKLYENPFVATLGWHLGSKPQQESIHEGYNQQVEDKLLASIDWRDDGYRFFGISALAGSCKQGWLGQIAESNCFTLKKSTFEKMGGYSLAFATPGGGFVNPDFFQRAISDTAQQLVILLGEGSFHQTHGGAVSGHRSRELLVEMKAEYSEIRGHKFDCAEPVNPPLFLGTIPQSSKKYFFN